MSQMLLLVLCAGVPLLLGLWAQAGVRRTFARCSQVSTAGGLTGAQAAEAVLRSSGLAGVSIRSLGVAAHAIPHACGYSPMHVRRALGAIALFRLVTLPVEVGASRRALDSAAREGVVGGRRGAGAPTHVTGFVAALGQLIFFFVAGRR